MARASPCPTYFYVHYNLSAHGLSITLMTDAVTSSKMSDNIYYSTWYYIPKANFILVTMRT
jgi:hypothetical protein